MKQGVFKTLVIGMVIITTIGCQTQPDNESKVQAGVTTTVVPGDEIRVDTPVAVTAPSPEQQATEARLLASVIRMVVIVSQDGESHMSTSHGTVKDGRYLVTHNHFTVQMSETRAAKIEGLKGVALYRADGTLLIEMPVMLCRVVHEEGETLVLDFGEDYFDRLGVPSAEFLLPSEVTLTAGPELAQVDWDGHIAHIDWVTVAGFEVIEGTQVMVLGNGLLPGASGGGVFLNGYHVANNWSTVARKNVVGETVEKVSYAAVNSSQVVGEFVLADTAAAVTNIQPEATVIEATGTSIASN